MNDLQLYQELVDKKADENSTNVFPNAGEIHAGIVMAKLFEKTEKSVNMVVGSFDGKVSDQPNYLEKLERCIDSKVSINIIFLQSPNVQSKAYGLLRSKKSQGFPITFKSATDEVRQRLSSTKTGLVHFSVFDDNKYRFEKDPNKYLAWVCFNDPQNAARLNSLFGGCFSKSQLIAQ